MIRSLLVLIGILYIAERPICQTTVTAKTIEMKSWERYKTLARKERMNHGGVPYKEISGSPFYHDDVVSADLMMNDGSVMEDITLQMDLYAGEIIATDKEGQKIFLDVAYYTEIRIEDENRSEVFRKSHPNHPDMFCQVLHASTDLLLFKMKEVEHVEMSQIQGGQREHINKFNKTTYYEIVRDGTVEKLSFKKKKFFKSFSKEEGQALKSFAKQEKLKLKEEQDFVRLVAYLDTMDL